MSFKEHMKEKCKEEGIKLKQMTLKDKIWYIWEYYKFPIIGTVIGLFLAISIGSAIYGNRFDTALSCIILNSRQTVEEPAVDTYFNDGFRQYIGLDPNSKIELDYSMSLGFGEDAAMSEYQYAMLAKITAMMSSKDLDVIIGPPDPIDHYGSMDGFLNLEEALPADLYEQVKDSVYSVKNEETGKTVPCGIRLDSEAFQEKTGLAIEDPVFTILSNTARIDTSVQLLRYLLEP